MLVDKQSESKCKYIFFISLWFSQKCVFQGVNHFQISDLIKPQKIFIFLTAK